MGNLIKDFWTYKYKDKSYYGVVEVVSGNLKYRSAENKHETRIEKALKFIEGKKVLSHMSVQSYNEYLNKHSRASRNEDEESFYPFFLEFEPHVKPGQTNFYNEYKKAVYEAYQTVNYLVYEKNVNEDDILIVINNSRSVYLFVNPVTYTLRPSKFLHEVYKKMYEHINDEIGFRYVDTNLFRHNGLIKTPGAYYAGGFVVPISFEELKNLALDPEKEQRRLTRKQRSIDKVIPGILSKGIEELYLNALEEIKNGPSKKVNKQCIQSTSKDNVIYLKSGISCIEHFESNIVETGQRNFALVGLAIGYKNAGYSQEQTLDAVQRAANRWKHDEDEKVIASKVRSVFKKDYNFSCSYLNDHVDLCGACKNCKFNKNVKKVPDTKFWVSRQIIDKLKSNKASLRHYKAYLVMSRNNLFEQYFNPETYNLDTRVIREFIKMADGEREVQNGLIKASINNGDKKYLIPNEFVDNGEYDLLGEQLKPYLIIFTHFTYKASAKYVMMKVKPQTIARILDYKSISSVYKLINGFVRAGLAVFKKGYLFSLYFSSYKVIAIDEYKYTKDKEETARKSKYEFKTGTYDINYGESKSYYRLSRGSP